MPFLANNNRILITDTDGDTVFDTDTDMPHIVQTYEGRISYDWAQVPTYQYPSYGYGVLGIAATEIEGLQPLVTLGDKIDFVVTRATLVSNGGGCSDSWTYNNWPFYLPSGQAFFQGSAMIEAGFTKQAQPLVRRLLHIYPDNAWGQLIASWHHSNISYEVAEEGDWPSINTAHTTTLDIKCWLGRFR